jgi:hypothetical protein
MDVLVIGMLVRVGFGEVVVKERFEAVTGSRIVDVGLGIVEYENEVSGAGDVRGKLVEGDARKPEDDTKAPICATDVVIESGDVEATVFDVVGPARSNTDGEVEEGSDMTVFSGKILDPEEYFEAIEIKGDNKTVVVDALPKVFKS